METKLTKPSQKPSGRNQKGQFTSQDHPGLSDGRPGRPRDRPAILEHIKSTFITAVCEVCENPLVQESLTAALMDKALREPMEFVEWTQRVFGQHFKPNTITEQRVIISFKVGTPPKDWTPNRLEEQEVIDV